MAAGSEAGKQEPEAGQAVKEAGEQGLQTSSLTAHLSRTPDVTAQQPGALGTASSPTSCPCSTEDLKSKFSFAFYL